jgi:hypothetical protein
MSFADNTISPFEIEDARSAAHKASELQRSVEDQIREASRKLATAERHYRELLTVRILELHAKDSVAWTACETIARGEKGVAKLRFERDIAKGVLESVQQQGFRYGADRRDLHRLIEWSQRRDLRTDAEPGDWSKQPTFGAGDGPDFDPTTGELRAA